MGKILHQSTNGRLIHCETCNKITLEFGIVKLCFTARKFDLLVQQLESLTDEDIMSSQRTRKPIQIAVTGGSCALVLSAEQVIALKELIFHPVAAFLRRPSGHDYHIPLN